MLDRFLLIASLTAATQSVGPAPTPLLGQRPTYGTSNPNPGPNGQAIKARTWIPDLYIGFNPQGVAVAGPSLLVSGYRSLDLHRSSGPCWLVRIAIKTGAVEDRIALPDPCRHAGGVAVAPSGTVIVSDTNNLFLIDGAGSGAAPRRMPLAPGFNGAFVTAQGDRVWVGTYNPKGPGMLYAFSLAALLDKTNPAPLSPEQAVAKLTISRDAQGAAFSADGRTLWVSRSSINKGALDRYDVATGSLRGTYAAPAALEGIAFDDGQALWAVSEAGSRHFYDSFPLRLLLPFHPLVMRVDPAALR